MFKFFVKAEPENDYFSLDGETLSHIKVARIKVNEEFIIVYNKKFYRVVLADNRARIIATLNENHEFAANLTLGVALIATRGWEILLEKATELGVRTIVPIVTKFTSTKEKTLGKGERFNRILKAAAEQSFRNEMPQIMPVCTLENFLVTYGADGALGDYERIIASEHEQTNSLSEVLFSPKSVFLVGPEGGFSQEEVALALKQGFKAKTLGPRILKTETACLWLLSRVKF